MVLIFFIIAVAYVNMGTSLAATGRCSAAGGVLARGARLEGAGVRDARAHAAARAAALQQLGALHAAQGRPRRALQAYHAAIKAAPPDYHPQVAILHKLFHCNLINSVFIKKFSFNIILYKNNFDFFDMI